jgi:hypothetical protein
VAEAGRRRSGPCDCSPDRAPEPAQTGIAVHPLRPDLAERVFHCRKIQRYRAQAQEAPELIDDSHRRRQHQVGGRHDEGRHQEVRHRHGDAPSQAHGLELRVDQVRHRLHDSRNGTDPDVAKTGVPLERNPARLQGMALADRSNKTLAQELLLDEAGARVVQPAQLEIQLAIPHRGAPVLQERMDPHLDSGGLGLEEAGKAGQEGELDVVGARHVKRALARHRIEGSVAREDRREVLNRLPHRSDQRFRQPRRNHPPAVLHQKRVVKVCPQSGEGITHGGLPETGRVSGSRHVLLLEKGVQSDDQIRVDAGEAGALPGHVQIIAAMMYVRQKPGRCRRRSSEEERAMFHRRVSVELILAAALSQASAAQSFNLRDLIPNLVEKSLTLDPGLVGGVNHTYDFSGSMGPEGRDAALALRAFNQQLAGQLSAAPFPSPSGGFTYEFEPGVGFTRSSESFGPIYADRAETIGKGQFNLGIYYSHASFERLDGIHLDRGDLRLITTHRDVNGDGELLHPYYEGDVMGTDLNLRVSTDVTAFVFNYGLSDRIDVGVVVPLVRLATTGDPTIHRFPGGTPLLFDSPFVTTAAFQASGSASGLGDINVRTKFLALRGPEARLALAADVWFPSGREQDLLGTGATRIRGSLIGSLRLGRFSPHINAGYTWASTPPDDRLIPGPPPRIPDEISYTGGFDLALGPRVTFAADILGRTLRGAQILGMTNRTFQANTNPDDTQPPVLTEAVLRTLTVRVGDVHTLLGSAGVKINPVGTLLVTLNALFAIERHQGLESPVTLFLGVDYSF